MAHLVLYTLVSVAITSLISLIGILTVSISLERLRKMLFFLVSFAAGALLGDVFIHLVPEISRDYGFGFDVSLYIILGMLVFFVLEKFVHWRHCHIPTSRQHPHPVVFMNLIGDALHNMIDGMIIAGSYIVSIPLGTATTFAVIFHEIPQEIGDFGILVHGGLSRAKALTYNFISASLSFFGAAIVLIIGAKIDNLIMFIVPFTAGGFLYIAGSDLIPEMHKESEIGKSFLQLVGMVLGIGVMAALVLIK